MNELKASLDKLETENTQLEKDKEDFVSVANYEMLKTELETTKGEITNQKQLLIEKDVINLCSMFS